MRGTEMILQALRREKIDTVFGYTGAAMIPMFDTLFDAPDIRFIMPRHEQGGAHAADGYARVTGKTGVVFATSGPGATNLVTGIATAYADSVPMVAFTGQVKTHLIGNDAFQEVDTTGITRPICKHNYLVTDIADLPRILREAFHIARSGRPGPVVIDLPVNVGAEEYFGKTDDKFDIPGYQPDKKLNDKQVDRIAAAIAESKRPVLYVGGGIIISGADKELLRLAEKADIPVTTSMMALGAFPSRHRLSLNMLGMHGTPWANYAVTGCDLLLAVGSRFDDRVTGKISAFAPNAKIVHIDVDPASLGKNVRVDYPLVSDAKAALKAILPKVKKTKRSEWIDCISAWKKDHPLNYEKTGLRPQAIIEKLSEMTKDRETIVCTEVGQHQMWTALFYKFSRPRSWVSSGGLGTMGYGLPAAMGAQVGRPDALVLNISGDGSFQMNLQELATIAQHKLPVKTVILNNSFLGMVRQWQQLFYDRRYAQTDMSHNPDFVGIAKAYGIHGMKLEDEKDTDRVLKEMLKHPGPVVLDAHVEREENVYPMVPAGEAIDRMIGGMA